VVDGHLLTSGFVPRTSFEKVAPNSVVGFGKKDGLGCDAGLANHFTQQELDGDVYLDQHWHEHAACYHVKGKGLVVITSCGHAGLINNIQHLKKVTGVDKIHAVVGGFHLAPTKAAYVNETVDALQKLNPDVIIPMHCSGQNFVNAVAAKMPERLVLNSTGSRYTFGD
jgi:7,8-dihydropterin-6-yl-methyl-4-(beta-D-ribofuranosyl)aminobenzene 5'-phosphate synthase